MAILRVLAGDRRGQIYPLESDRHILGRDSEDVPILDQGVSRRHAEVIRAGEMFLVRDLESRNGTFVNDEKITEWVLRSGDRVQVGNTILAFEDKYARAGDSRIISFASTANDPANTVSLKLARESATEAEDDHRRLQVLYRVSRILGTSEDFETTMQKVARTMGRALGAEHVYLFEFHDDPNDEFHLVAGYDSKEVDELAVSRTILQRVRSEGRPILSSDAMLDDRFATTKSVVVQQIKSLLCVPLTVMNEPIGAFYATNSKLTEMFSTEDLELATIIGMLVGNSLEMWELLERQGSLYRSVLKILAEVAELRDPHHRGRAERIATYCAAIGRALGFGDSQTQKMWVAGFLHDIGALGLTQEELRNSVNVAQRKARQAAEILGRIPDLSEITPAIVGQGERLDGSGYPEGLRGEDAIPEGAQIVGLARELELLLSEGGPDGGELSAREALIQIRELAPTKFSTRVVNGLLVAYRRNRLFREDRGIFRPGAV